MGNKHGTPTSSAQGRQKSANVREKPSIFPSAAKGRAYDYVYKVVLSGDRYSGKSRVLSRLAGENFTESYIPTIMFDILMYTVSLDEIRYKLQVWDTYGQDRSRNSTHAYYQALGIVIVYDASRQNSFDNVPCWIEEARKYGHPDATLMLVGTKCDSEKKVVAYETAKELADENDSLFFEVSAKDETNIELALLTLVAEIRRKHVNMNWLLITALCDKYL